MANNTTSPSESMASNNTGNEQQESNNTGNATLPYDIVEGAILRPMHPTRSTIASPRG
ncbi:MAG: hypothetical protein WCC17_17035 [Candidatus Nitrosopolaris sp.]